MDNEKLVKELREELKKVNIEFSIKKAPKFTLTECLNFYTKDNLFALANEHKSYIAKAKKKAEMIELLEEILLNNIEKDSLYITEAQRKTIADVIKKVNLNEINMEDTRSFKNLGYIYWFYHNNEIQIVCPDEIAEKYMNSYEKDNEEIIKMNNDLYNYARALQHIYGVYEAEQLAAVWNKYNEEKIDEEFVFEFMDVIGRRQNCFWWDSPYIVSDYFMEIEEYEDFLQTRIKKEYYMPSKKEIEYYMEEEFDIDNLYYKKMLNYFEQQKSLNEVQLGDLMLSIEMGCIFNNSFQDIINIINDSGFKFKNLDELNKFMRNYIDLSNNTRKWEIKGYKPVELSEVKSNILNDNKVIQFEKPAKKKKIGRNEPCPCGSGKKFKFCCRS